MGNWMGKKRKRRVQVREVGSEKIGHLGGSGSVRVGLLGRKKPSTGDVD